MLKSAGAAQLKTNYGKRVDAFKGDKMNEILTGNRSDGLCGLTPPPPVAELNGIGTFLAEKVGRGAIA